MSRRAVLLCCLFAVASQLSSGCYYCCHPFLWRWGCGPCGAPCGAPCCPTFPTVGGECCSSCFAPPATYAPANPAPGTIIAGPGVGYPTAPPVFNGQPGTVIPPPQVLKDNPMPMTPMK
jgi:hypothetical protein